MTATRDRGVSYFLNNGDGSKFLHGKMILKKAPHPLLHMHYVSVEHVDGSIAKIAAASQLKSSCRSCPTTQFDLRMNRKYLATDLSM